MTRFTERIIQPVRDKPGDETAAPYTMATWEYPPCDGCGGECIFTDGLCAGCWRAYTETVS